MTQEYGPDYMRTSILEELAVRHPECHLTDAEFDDIMAGKSLLRGLAMLRDVTAYAVKYNKDGVAYYKICNMDMGITLKARMEGYI